ncbi:MAG: hypothetical protein MI784_08585 [Cytophagales bacterium]|nr:hypothetical protein [Cytophagales bacterium]
MLDLLEEVGIELTELLAQTVLYDYSLWVPDALPDGTLVPQAEREEAQRLWKMLLEGGSKLRIVKQSLLKVSDSRTETPSEYEGFEILDPSEAMPAEHLSPSQEEKKIEKSPFLPSAVKKEATGTAPKSILKKNPSKKTQKARASVRYDFTSTAHALNEADPNNELVITKKSRRFGIYNNLKVFSKPNRVIQNPDFGKNPERVKFSTDVKIAGTKKPLTEEEAAINRRHRSLSQNAAIENGTSQQQTESEKEQQAAESAIDELYQFEEQQGHLLEGKYSLNAGKPKYPSSPKIGMYKTYYRCCDANSYWQSGDPEDNYKGFKENILAQVARLLWTPTGRRLVKEILGETSEQPQFLPAVDLQGVFLMSPPDFEIVPSSLPLHTAGAALQENTANPQFPVKLFLPTRYSTNSDKIQPDASFNPDSSEGKYTVWPGFSWFAFALAQAKALQHNEPGSRKEKIARALALENKIRNELGLTNRLHGECKDLWNLDHPEIKEGVREAWWIDPRYSD